MSCAIPVREEATQLGATRTGLSMKALAGKTASFSASKGPNTSCTPLNTSLLAELVGAANCSALARQLHPKLLEGLDAALAALEPLKVAESQGPTEQLFLKALKNAPEQVVDATGMAVKNSLGPGDYLVLQTPVIPTLLPSSSSVPKKEAKPFGKGDLNLPSTSETASLSVSTGFNKAESSASPKVDDKSEACSPMGMGKEDNGLALNKELQKLRKHKDWADKLIEKLIGRVRDSEGPQRLLKQEVQQLRLEKDAVETKLKDFESSLKKLKDCTYNEAAQRQEYELTLRQVQAELRGASLREQEVQASIRNAQSQLRQEKKRRESLDKRFQKAADEKSAAQAATAEAEVETKRLEEELKATKQALSQQALEMQRSRDEAIAAQLEAKAATAWAAELERKLFASEAAASGQIEELQGIIAVLNAQLDEASSHTDTSEQESLYSHFDGKAIFGGNSFWVQESNLY